MKLRSALALTVLLAMASGALAGPPADQAGQMSITGTIVAIHPKGSLITVEPLSGAQLQTQQAVVKPGKKAGPITVLVDELTVVTGSLGKGKPTPGKLGKQPPLGKQKPIPGQSKALVAEEGAVMTDPAEMVAPADTVFPSGQTPASDAAAAAQGVFPSDGVTAPPDQSQAIASPADQVQTIGKPQQKPPIGKPDGKPQPEQTVGKPTGQQTPSQAPGKPTGKIRSMLDGLQVGQMVNVIYVALSPPFGPEQAAPSQKPFGKARPTQAPQSQSGPQQAVPSQTTPSQFPGKAKPQQTAPEQTTPGQTVPNQSKATSATGRGVAVEMVQSGFEPTAQFRAISIRVLSALNRPMPSPAFEPPAEPEPAPPSGPAAPAAPAGPGGAF